MTTKLTVLTIIVAVVISIVFAELLIRIGKLATRLIKKMIKK